MGVLNGLQVAAQNKVEDSTYYLLSIFRVFMPLIYSERNNALTQLKSEIKVATKETRSHDGQAAHSPA